MKLFINSVLFSFALSLFGVSIWGIYELGLKWFWISWFINLGLSIALSMYIFLSERHATAKMSWMLAILSLPLVGILLYIAFGAPYSNKSYLNSQVARKSRFYEIEDYSFTKKIYRKNTAQSMFRIFSFMTNTSRRPIYENTKVRYLFDGYDKLKAVLEHIERAEKFINIQYYIIKEGYMWDLIRERLEQKAKEGVEIRILYDSVGSLTSLNRRRVKSLEKIGVKVASFNPWRFPFFSGKFNYRNHRKCIIIDNKYALTGGLNIGDEYLSNDPKMGYWRDTHLLLEGESVNSLNLVFAYDWYSWSKEDLTKNKAKYFPKYKYKGKDRTIVQIIDDGPDSNETVMKDIFIKHINSAKTRVWITSPYLIMSDDLISAMINAARSGVDVRIITPGVADKRYILRLTRSHYKKLMLAGVRIYEYASFIHAKQLLIDEEFSIVGSMNLDYRSLFLNFETAVVMYGQEQVDQLQKQLSIDMKNSSEILNPNKFSGKIINKIFISLLKIFVPIL